MFPPAGPQSGTGGSALRLSQKLLAGRCRRGTQACFLPHVPANLPCVNWKKLDLGASSLSVIMASHPKGGREKPLCKYQNSFISHSVFSRQCLWPSILFQLVVCRKRSRVMRGEDLREGGSQDMAPAWLSASCGTHTGQLVSLDLTFLICRRGQ